jgi:Co/Zn/Cd efflux system component
MNTGQLLLVSTLGLCVNLFGMFAMGGHHHHVLFFVKIVYGEVDLFAGWALSFPWSFALGSFAFDTPLSFRLKLKPKLTNRKNLRGKSSFQVLLSTTSRISQHSS